MIFARRRFVVAMGGHDSREEKERKWVSVIVVLLPWGFKGGLWGFGEVVAVVWSWWRSWSGIDGVVWGIKGLNDAIFYFFLKKIKKSYV